MRRASWETSTLYERIEAIKQLRGIKGNELARRAGLDRGVLSRIGRRTQQAEVGTLDKIARAAGVSFDWLARGVGQPEMPGVSAADPYPNRQEAARITREGGVEESAVAAILAEPFQLSRDPSVLWWIHLIESRAALERAGGPPPREPAITPPTSSGPRRTLRKAEGDEK